MQGDVTATKGTLDLSLGNLTIKDTAGTELGGLTIGANGAWAGAAGKVLTVGALNLAKDMSVGNTVASEVAELHLQSIAASTKGLTLNNGGTIKFQDATGAATAVSVKSGTTVTADMLNFNTGGTLYAGTITLGDANHAANASSANGLNVYATSLILNGSGTG